MINVRIKEDNGGYARKDAASMLAAACDMLDVDLVKALLSKGADPNFPSASLRGGEPGSESPLRIAASTYIIYREDACEKVKRLKENSVRVEIVKLLLATGADINTYKDIAKVPEGNPDLRKYLLEHGASTAYKESADWNDDKSIAKPRSHSVKDLTSILQCPSLVALEFRDTIGDLAKVSGTWDSITSLTLHYIDSGESK